MSVVWSIHRSDDWDLGIISRQIAKQHTNHVKQKTNDGWVMDDKFDCFAVRLTNCYKREFSCCTSAI
jgi:hypothetical protein